ncbi:MAG: hypothetical protein R3B54_09625 [Bdellovibrionota bacterium]
MGHVGALIEQRSNGIKDLRHGAMVDEDLKYGEPAIFLVFDKRTPVPPLPGALPHPGRQSLQGGGLTDGEVLAMAHDSREC